MSLITHFQKELFEKGSLGCGSRKTKPEAERPDVIRAEPGRGEAGAGQGRKGEGCLGAGQGGRDECVGSAARAAWRALADLFI